MNECEIHGIEFVIGSDCWICMEEEEIANRPAIIDYPGACQCEDYPCCGH